MDTFVFHPLFKWKKQSNVPALETGGEVKASNTNFRIFHILFTFYLEKDNLGEIKVFHTKVGKLDLICKFG